jgi:hypothetical protein
MTTRPPLLKILVRGSLVSALAVILLTIYMQFALRFSPEASSEGFRSPGLAMQFATTSDEARRIMPDPSDRAVMAKGQRLDFCLIALYWLLYILLAVLLASRNVPGSRALGLAALLFASLAAWFDILENRAILEIINAWQTIDNNSVAPVSGYSQLKWSTAFAATLLLSALFVPRKDFDTGTGKLSTVTGLALAGSAIAGWIGLIHHSFIPVGLGAMSTGIMLLAALFAFTPSRFLSGTNFR